MKIKKKEGSYNDYVCDLSYSELIEIEKAMSHSHTGPVADELYGGLKFFLDRLPKPGEEPQEEGGDGELGPEPGGFDLSEFGDDQNAELPGSGPEVPGEGGGDPTLQELGIEDGGAGPEGGPEGGLEGSPEGDGPIDGPEGDLGPEDPSAAADAMLDAPPEEEEEEPALPPR